jgi:serine protease Do
VRAARPTWLAWFALGPLFVATGAACGIFLLPRPAPAPVHALPFERVVGIPSLAPVVELVRDAVVAVRTEHDVLAGAQPSEAHDIVDGESRGTGFVFDPKGLVLTAHHLVVAARRIEVEIAGLGTLRATVVGDDATTDLAVLRIESPPRPLTSVVIASTEDVRQGDWIVTVGNPLSFRRTVGAGVVGYVGRHLRHDGLTVSNEYLQYSAPVHPGSSGSPVFDLAGRVIGMTTRAAADGEGLGFAVGGRTIRKVLEVMERDEGRVRRAQLGIAFRERMPEGPGIEPARTPRADAAHDPRGGPLRDAGVAIEVTEVVKGQAAERAGLRVGDIILSLDAEPLTSAGDFYDRVTWSRPGREVLLVVHRDGQALGPVAVALGEVGPRDPGSQPQ